MLEVFETSAYFGGAFSASMWVLCRLIAEGLGYAPFRAYSENPKPSTVSKEA